MAGNPRPTFQGYTSWVYNTLGVPVAWLPNDSEWLQWSYDMAVATVNRAFMQIPGPIYLVMVYNLAGHILMSNAPDTTTVPPYPFITLPDGQTYGYFGYFRQQNNVNGFTTGIVTSASDEGTSASMAVPPQLENLTIGQLQLTTTPWGRTYLGYAQDFGTNWGIS